MLSQNKRNVFCHIKEENLEKCRILSTRRLASWGDWLGNIYKGKGHYYKGISQ